MLPDPDIVILTAGDEERLVACRASMPILPIGTIFRILQ